MSNDSLAEYDYIVIGSGSAGSVVANRLSTDPDTKVLVLESGGMDNNLWLKLPIGYFRSIYDSRFSRVFDTEPNEGDGHRGIVWPRGHVVGDSSSINGLVFNSLLRCHAPALLTRRPPRPKSLVHMDVHS